MSWTDGQGQGILRTVSLAAWYALARLTHFIGFAMAAGGSFAAFRAHAAARRESAPEKAGWEGAAAEIVTKVELPGLFLALFAGIALVAMNPAQLSPAKSGAGPWLHLKLTLVLVLLVVSHLRMFRSRKLARERSQGVAEVDCDALLGRAQKLARIDLALFATVFFVAIFRYVLFT